MNTWISRYRTLTFPYNLYNKVVPALN